VFTDDIDLEKNVRLNGSKLITELLKQTVTFEIHVAVGVKITVSSCVTPRSLADGHDCFRQTSVGLERASFALKLETVASSEILFSSV
jgi:hypothetical protein